jgi:hypothetical protein
MEDIECLERENEKEITVRMERFHQVFRISGSWWFTSVTFTN